MTLKYWVPQDYCPKHFLIYVQMCGFVHVCICNNVGPNLGIFFSSYRLIEHVEWALKWQSIREFSDWLFSQVNH